MTQPTATETSSTGIHVYGVYVPLPTEGLTDGESFTLATYVQRSLESEEAFLLEAEGLDDDAEMTARLIAYTGECGERARQRILAARTKPLTELTRDEPTEVRGPCDECGCYPGERAEGSDGDPSEVGLYQQWQCECDCHGEMDD